MATRRKSKEDEVPEPRGKIVVPAKRVAKRPPLKKPARSTKVNKRATRKVAAEDLDNAIDDEDQEANVRMPAPEMDGLPQHSQRSIELSAQMQSRLHSQPVFPYPPELSPELRPYWLELVNSFAKAHFQVSDITMMKMYCQCAYDIERQTVMIETEGEVVIGGRGNAIVNPRCKVRESNRATLMSLATKFRNQPASRMNTDNFKRRKQRAAEAAQGADAVMDDPDGLLAGGDDDFEDDLPLTRH